MSVNKVNKTNGSLSIIAGRGQVVQFSVMPVANASRINQIVQYTGTTTASYTNGYFYKCVLDGSNYVWENVQVQSASGGSAVDSVNGKTGTVVLDAKDIGLQVDTMPTAESAIVNQIVQYTGTTNGSYTNGQFYKCVYDSGTTTYIWQNILVDNVYTKTEIGSLSSLPDTTKDIVQNISAINTAVADKANKVTSAVDGNLAGLDSNGDLTDSGIAANDVATKVSSAVSGHLAGLDGNGDITDSGIVSTTVVTTSSTAGLIKNDGTIDTNTYATTTALGNKADKVTSATANDFAALDSNGNLIDSGINKNIVPSGATSSNKLATANDIPTELNDLSVDVEVTNPVNAQVLTYNSTSGKWENQTGSAPVGGATFQGSILFANLPTTGMANGDWYDIKDAFTTDNRFEEGSGIACAAGTDVIWVNSDSKWNILTPSGVFSFNGRTGAITPASGDYTASDVGLGSVVNTGDSDTPTNGGTTKFTTGGAYTELNKKVDKLTSGFTSGHLASLDSNGAIADSGKSASDFSEDAWWTSTATVDSSSQVTFSGLSNSYAYELFCEDTLAYITNVTKTTQSSTITLTYTLSGASQGTVCKLRIVK